MDTMRAFVQGQLNQGKELKVFDWKRAAQLIKDAGAKNASAGLSGDWEWTGGPIFADGKPVKREDTYVYLASTWATPELTIDDGPPMACFVMQSQTPEHDAHTYWPEEALAILRGTP